MSSKVAFISHASEDAETAGIVCTYLERNGVSCWIAPRDVRPGRDFAAEIIDGIETSAVLVLILSENANDSVFVKREVERAVSKGKPVFPIRVREVAPSKSLELFVSTAHWIDAWQPPIEQHLGRLAESIRSTATAYQGSAALPEDSAAWIRAPAHRGKWLAVAAVVAVVATAIAYVVLRPAAEVPRPPPIADRPPAQAPAAKADSTAQDEAAPRPAAPRRPTPAAGPQIANASVQPTTAGAAEPCPTRLSINRDLPTPFTCTCDAGAARGASVWGTDFYTDDSDLCRAAVHAGVIAPNGGSVTVVRTPGRALYAGTRRNGVQSSDFGAYAHSIRFEKPL